jgi:hypothetical protein
MKLEYEFPALSGQADNGTVRLEAEVFAQRNPGWVEDFEILLERIASQTGIDQIVIVANEVRPSHLRQDVIDGERRLSVGIPHLPLQAVNAAKLELVTQPVFVFLVVAVAGGAVLAVRDRRREGEGAWVR